MIEDRKIGEKEIGTETMRKKYFFVLHFSVNFQSLKKLLDRA